MILWGTEKIIDVEKVNSKRGNPMLIKNSSKAFIIILKIGK